jgi:hypothetical protein
MADRWIRSSGNCNEDGLSGEVMSLNIDTFGSRVCFVAFLTDRFLAGEAETLNFEDVSIETWIDTTKLLEIRIFGEKAEWLARRSIANKKVDFQWRLASEYGMVKDEFCERTQTLDIDESEEVQGQESAVYLPEGNRGLMTTGGGKYQLPIKNGENAIKVISYIEYDEDGMAYVYDNRLVGFCQEKGD